MTRVLFIAPTAHRVGDAYLDIEATEGCIVDDVAHDGVRYVITRRLIPRVTIQFVGNRL
ncbi:MAG: hypothetical protein ABR543_09825 [Gemmatimonadaceae bacterium]